MSIEFKSNVHRTTLVNFLANEYRIQSGIPVQLYSVVNASFSEFNRMLAITDNSGGVLFLDSPRTAKAYGNGNPFGMVKTLKQCGVKLVCQD